MRCAHDLRARLIQYCLNFRPPLFLLLRTLCTCIFSLCFSLTIYHHTEDTVKHSVSVSPSMRRALVFSGQGSHRQCMSMEFLRVPEVARLWERMKSRMEQNYGISIQNVISENPQKIQVFNDALDLKVICSRSCHSDCNAAESTPRGKTLSHPQGVMSLTYLTQPCILAAHMTTLEYLKVKKNFSVEDATVVAGHSLGEFSALCALNVFPPDVAVDLVYKRGVLMEDALDHFSVSRDNYLMYACNPVRAKLDDDDMDLAVDKFHIFVELVARALSTTTSFVEVVNYNVDHEQYVVAGDLVGLSALGKCLDPQFRASSCGASASLDHIVRTAVSSVWQDKLDGVTMYPNKEPPPDFVTSAIRKYGIRSTFRRFMRGPDDGHTLSLSELTHLTLQDDGRSGLKKKSWFLPLAVHVPFHSSLLRRAMDNFLPVVREALPGEKRLRALLGVDREGSTDRPMWITNLTGGAFRPFDADFQREAIDIMHSMNVGEVRHNGRYQTDIVEELFRQGIAGESVRDMCAAVLAAQLAHPVQWIDVMDAAVLGAGCRVVHEISPVRTTAEMFKRTAFREAPKAGQEGQQNEPLQIITRCLPSEERFL